MHDENARLTRAKAGHGVTSARVRQRLVEWLVQQGVEDRRVLLAMRETPRHLFVDEVLAPRAYENTALPIGFGQTISQPYIVAKMTSLLLKDNPRPLERVLEVGTGCGYQAAVLSSLADQVYGIERIAQLATSARLRLHHLGYMNTRVRHGDGMQGLPYYAPFQAIIIAAAAKKIPTALIDQLDMGGRLVAPLEQNGQQRLILLEKNRQGINESSIEMVNFVPLLAGVEE